MAASTHLTMIRDDFRDRPVYTIPEGYSIRWHQPGDEEQWRRLQQRADEINAITAALFRDQFGDDPAEHARRIAYLIDPEGHFAGTAAAWYGSARYGTDIGRVHWVAIDPDYQGRRLSYPLMGVILDRLEELGHASVYLTTDTRRPAAVRLYERLGFRRVSD